MTSLKYLLQFIEEDAPWGDITSRMIIPDVSCWAVVRSKDRGIIAGLSEARTLFDHFGVLVHEHSTDGSAVAPGEILFELNGPARAILLVERTALNIIGRMSGIATQTRRAVDAAKTVSPTIRIAATRKTAPGFRTLDKEAVIIGGGDPHRYSLSDMVLIKDNHLAVVPLDETIRKVKEDRCYVMIEVEVETAEDAITAADAGADIILLDNMTPDAIRETLEGLSRQGLRDKVLLEVSGGVDGDDLLEYAATGVDVISIGALTHTVKNFDVSLDILADRI